jgi:glycosyltransferase involved in cell wall biosynthesis
MHFLADIRALQDPAYARRGIGSHAAFLLRAVREHPVAATGIIGLVDPRLGPLPPEHRDLCDTLRPAFVHDRIDEPAVFLALSPLTHDSLLPARLLDRPHILALAAVYDFIPLEFPDRYLAGRDALVAYAASVKWLDAFQAFLPISEHCGAQVVRRVGVDPGRVSVTGVALREAFARRLHGQTLPPARPAGAADETLLFVGGPDPRKDLETVVAAHAALVTAGRPALQLVVGGGYPDAWQQQVRKDSRDRTGITTDIRFLSHVSDEELAAWHAHARATVTASQAEGFSMPVIEAIASGGLSVASDIPVHRELIDQPEALFAAGDGEELATKLTEILRCPALRDRLRARQRPVAARFVPEAVAARVTEALDRHVASFLAARRTAPRRRRPAIAFVTPFPPDRSGVADYSKQCVAALAQFVDVDVYTDASEPAADPAIRAFHPISAAAWLRPDYDAVVAVAGNSDLHTKILDLHRRFGGACIVHDNRLTELTAWVKGAEHVRGIAERSLGRAVALDEVEGWLVNPGTLPTLCYDEMLERAEPLFVHSAGIRSFADRLYGVDAVHLPFCIYRGFSAEALSADARRNARDALGIPQDQLVVISLGILDRVKRPEVCVEALARLHALGRQAHLYFVGAESAGVREWVSALADSCGIAGAVHYTPEWISEDDYRRYILAADAAIQLRAHFYGGISGALMDCVAAGLPTVANDDLAAAIDAPSYVERVPDRPEVGKVAEAMASCLARRADHGRREEERTEFADAHSFDTYARLLLTRLLGPLPAWAADSSRSTGTVVGRWALRRLFVDATLTSRSPSGSGVHRVVTRTWHELERLAAAEGLDVAPVIVRDGRFTTARDETPITFSGGDLLLLPDAYWACGEVWPAVEQARAAGALSIPVVYDLIPMQHPEIYGADGAAMFRQYLAAVIAHADLIVTISETVARDLAAAMPEFRFPRRGPELFPWRLGSDLPDLQRDVRPGVRGLFDGRLPVSSYLVVGAIEPRKNHGFLLDAFEQLWEKPETAHLRLVIAGRPGFKSEAILRRIKSDPRYGSQLFLLADLDDAEIDHAYRHARAVIFASLAEGFGLPIVEALRHGQTVIASDLAIHREVGGTACDFFTLAEPERLVAAIMSHEARSGSRAAACRAGVPPLTWADAAARLLDGLRTRLGERERSGGDPSQPVLRIVA